MNTEAHGFKKTFVDLIQTKYGGGMGIMFIRENQWLIK
jgi:hypothetical protein